MARPFILRGSTFGRAPQDDRERASIVVTIRNEKPADVSGREALLDEAFGEERFRKSSERLREGQLPAAGLSFVATENRRVIATARMWPVDARNGARALLLGPVAVACDAQCRGIGGALVRRAIRYARKLGYAAILLVGDAPYYSRFGFSAAKTGALAMPGPFERHRLLALELEPGALHGATGTIAAAGEPPERLARAV
jgi:predicted N-acetyltransferase YhbS